MPSKIFDPSTEEFEFIINTSLTVSEVLEKIGLKNHRSNKERLRKRALEEKISLSHLSRIKRYSILWRLTSEEIHEFVKNSASFSEVLQKIGLRARGANFKTLYSRLSRESIDVSHFFKKKADTKSVELNTLLVKDSKKISRLKDRLVDGGFLKNICVWCGISSNYNKKPISLHVDHIDGDPTNNELDNLRILCPNCHSQTETFGGKNNRKRGVGLTSLLILNKPVKKEKYCCECFGPVSTGSLSGFCRKCSYSSRYPGLEKLIEDLGNLSFVGVGKKYGVSDNAVRKWLRRNEVDPKTIRKNLVETCL